MSGHPSVNFGQSGSGQFSPQEVARLMEREVQRALRYGHPLSLLCIEIDRLESLHDLYGVESERRIQNSVAVLLRSSTRASDVLGTARGQQLLICLPHTPREGAVALARRLLAGSRELEFRGEGRSLRASLSIGIATHGKEEGLARLTERAELALRAAVAGGGDRFVEYERSFEPAAPTLRVSEVAPVVPARARPSAAPPPPPLPAVHELPGATLEEKVHTLLQLAGGPAGLSELEREVLAILQQVVGEVRAPRSREEVLAEIRVLEERIAQQKNMLDASEEELERMIREKSVDPGAASIYRSVQGLDPSEANFKKKKELLAVIYRANVELLAELEREARRSR
jgi:diguanylate cyclase (GGDEF)-like protein